MSEFGSLERSEHADTALEALIDSAFESGPLSKQRAVNPSVEEYAVELRLKLHQQLLRNERTHGVWSRRLWGQAWGQATPWPFSSGAIRPPEQPSPSRVPAAAEALVAAAPRAAAPVLVQARSAMSVRLEDVADALNRSEWDFRTVAGIALDLGVPTDVVAEKLNAYPELVRWLPVTDADGAQLLVSRRHRITRKERLLRFRAYFAKSP